MKFERAQHGVVVRIARQLVERNPARRVPEPTGADVGTVVFEVHKVGPLVGLDQVAS